MRFTLTIQPERGKQSGDSLEDLWRIIKDVENKTYFQVWIEQEDGSALMIVFNRDFAIAHDFSVDGGGALALDPNFAGNEEGSTLYLENGEHHEYSTSDCIPRAQGVRLITDYFEHGQRPEWLVWIED